MEKSINNIPTKVVPESLSIFFWGLSSLALQGFGGVLPVVQKVLVDKKKWLTLEEFSEDWAVSQILPGPNIINLSVILGDRYFGFKGCLVGIAGILTLPLLLVLSFGILYTGISEDPRIQGALHGLGAVAAGLIGSSALRLLIVLKTQILGLRVCWILMLLTFFAIGIFKLPLFWVICTVGLGSCFWSYQRLSFSHNQEANK